MRYIYSRKKNGPLIDRLKQNWYLRERERETERQTDRENIKYAGTKHTTMRPFIHLTVSDTLVEIRYSPRGIVSLSFLGIFTNVFTPCVMYQVSIALLIMQLPFPSYNNRMMVEVFTCLPHRKNQQRNDWIVPQSAKTATRFEDRHYILVIARLWPERIILQ